MVHFGPQKALLREPSVRLVDSEVGELPLVPYSLPGPYAGSPAAYASPVAQTASPVPKVSSPLARSSRAHDRRLESIWSTLGHRRRF
jgi:hypothetical protein